MSDTQTVSRLVVVGASAGGVEALTLLVGTLVADFPAPIVIAQHLDPQYPSHLAGILSRRCALPVRTVTSSEPLQNGVVFVVPANRHVEIAQHQVHVREDGPGRSKPSIDALLSSAATAFGEDLIAVILTGSGSDGTAGAYAVKAAGGTVIIQNPETARFPAMPRSLAPTTVDMTIDLEHIGSLVYALLTGTHSSTDLGEPELLHTLLDDVRQRQGIDFTRYKMPTIRRRLQYRLVATGMETLASYRAYLHTHADEYNHLVSSFLIKVTEFFRDPELFRYLREVALPSLIAGARTRGNELRIWSAGCATGEEAYSLAILITELLGPELDHFSVRIFATDLDARAVAFARRGIYTAAALTSVPPAFVTRYFTHPDGEYEVVKRVRSLVIFGQHDLAQRAPFPRIDLCLCRNVLIYFTPELQQRALQLFAFSLRDEGILVLGKSEAATPLDAAFWPVEPHLKSYRRIGDHLRTLPPWIRHSLPSAIEPRSSTGAAPQAAAALDSSVSPFLLVAGDVWEQLPVGMVMINRSYDIQRINSAAQRLLNIHQAALGEDVLHLVAADLSAPLRVAIDATLAGATIHTIEEIVVTEPATAEQRYLQISCVPSTGNVGQSAETAILLVTDVTAIVHTRQELEQALALQQSDSTRLAATLHQVVESNRHLLLVNESLTTANRALHGMQTEVEAQAAHAQAETEEAITVNEEMQATNEELETLNEELQATMEELEVTTTDARARSEELQDLAATREVERVQLAAVLASIGDAVAVIDQDGRAIRTNEAYDTLSRSDIVIHDEQDLSLAPTQLPQARAGQGETFTQQLTLVEIDGTRRWAEAIGKPLQGGTAGQTLLVIHDVTATSQQRRMQEEFIALAAHELRTPLTALQGYLDLLLRAPGRNRSADTTHRYATIAYHQARRLSLLVRDLVDVARLQSGKLTIDLTPLDLVLLVTQSVEAIVELRDPGQIPLISLRTETAVPLWVRGDATRLEQVVLNLVNNALTHAHTATTIMIDVRPANGGALLSVRDNGAGIPAEALRKIFTRFYQIARTDHSAHGGMGLGLFICEELVAAHSGSIMAESTVGEGTAFTVWLPLVDREQTTDGTSPGTLPLTIKHSTNEHKLQTIRQSTNGTAARTSSHTADGVVD